MTIKKGELWGAEAPRPDDLEVADGDAPLAAAVAAALASTPSEVPAFGVARGDLLRTLGHASAPTASERTMHFPMDLGFVAADGGPEIPFVAHVLARGFLWSGEGFVAMNAGWMGDKYLGPKAHPNDGVIDTTQGRLSVQTRWQARERAKSGTHLPHPDLQVRRVRETEVELAAGRPRRLWVDGQAHGRCRNLSLRVVPDAFTLVI